MSDLSETAGSAPSADGRPPGDRPPAAGGAGSEVDGANAAGSSVTGSGATGSPEAGSDVGSSNGAGMAGRCRLRDFVADDAASVGAWLEDSTLRAVSMRSWLPRVLADRRIVARVADHCDAFGSRQPCGFLRLDVGPDQSAEVTVLVAPEVRRCGVGRRLLAEADHVAALRGLRVVVAWVEAPNPGAMALFAAAGYAPTRSESGIVTMGRFQRFERAVADVGPPPLEILP